jgi:protein-S-isoprenylcysteine O-methyltransferase Ste14
MGDFLRGTLGLFLQIILSIISIILIFVGFFSCAIGHGGQTVIGWILFILGVLCGCAVFGIRYWLGHVVRMR